MSIRAVAKQDSVGILKCTGSKAQAMHLRNNSPTKDEAGSVLDNCMEDLVA